MSRIVFEPGQQRKFLEEVNASGLTWKQIAEVSGCCDRTIRDWRREKYNMSHEVAIQLKDISGVVLPPTAKVLPEYWSTIKAAKAGGIASIKLYGNPGTLEGRRKGGRISQARRRENPDLYKSIAPRIRKPIVKPNASPLLAEFVGILLGDGSIKPYQVAITINKKTETEYIGFIIDAIEKLFGIIPSIDHKRYETTNDIVISSINLVEYLQSIGLKKGNKVKQQVEIPSWIFENEAYMRACIRGLIDTDGCVFHHSYKVAGKTYRYVKMEYASRSLPLLYGAEEILSNLGFHPRNNGHNRVYLYRVADAHKYFKEIGTSNSKHLIRYNRFCKLLKTKEL